MVTKAGGGAAAAGTGAAAVARMSTISRAPDGQAAPGQLLLAQVLLQWRSQVIIIGSTAVQRRRL